MAARLTVIMIESPPPTAAAARLADDIVGNLIGRPGIDMTLVRSLLALEELSTDRLTLESITTDVAVLDWQPPQMILDALHAVGFAGWRARHAWDLEPPPEPVAGRKIYAFDLTQASDAAGLIEALQNLRAERDIQTFTIGSIAEVPRRQALPSISIPPTPPTVSTASDPPRVSPAAEIDLDDLIDQLDRLDT